jgi:hypothetical protein
MPPGLPDPSAAAKDGETWIDCEAYGDYPATGDVEEPQAAGNHDA